MLSCPSVVLGSFLVADCRGNAAFVSEWRKGSNHQWMDGATDLNLNHGPLEERAKPLKLTHLLFTFRCRSHHVELCVCGHSRVCVFRLSVVSVSAMVHKFKDTKLSSVALKSDKVRSLSLSLSSALPLSLLACLERHCRCSCWCWCCCYSLLVFLLLSLLSRCCCSVVVVFAF